MSYKDLAQRRSVRPPGADESLRAFANTREYLPGEALENPKAGKMTPLVEGALPDLLPQISTRCRLPLGRHGRRKVPEGFAAPGPEFSTGRPLLRAPDRGRGPQGLMTSTPTLSQLGPRTLELRLGPWSVRNCKVPAAPPREARTLARALGPLSGTWCLGQSGGSIQDWTGLTKD